MLSCLAFYTMYNMYSSLYVNTPEDVETKLVWRLTSGAPIVKYTLKKYLQPIETKITSVRCSRVDQVLQRIQKKLSEGVQLRAIIGPSAKRHLNGVSLACWWWPNIECWLGSFVIFQEIWTRNAEEPYIFVIFQGGGGTPPPLDPHMVFKLF